MSDEFDEDDVVRDRKGRFKPGSRGNPRGAPKKERRTFLPAQTARDFHGVLEAEITISIDGRARKVPVTVAAMHKLAEMALNGSMPALKLLLQHDRQIRKDRAMTIEAMSDWLNDWFTSPQLKKIDDRNRDLMREVIERLEGAEYRPD